MEMSTKLKKNSEAHVVAHGSKPRGKAISRKIHLDVANKDLISMMLPPLYKILFINESEKVLRCVGVS